MSTEFGKMFVDMQTAMEGLKRETDGVLETIARTNEVVAKRVDEIQANTDLSVFFNESRLKIDKTMEMISQMGNLSKWVIDAEAHHKEAIGDLGARMAETLANLRSGDDDEPTVVRFE